MLMKLNFALGLHPIQLALVLISNYWYRPVHPMLQAFTMLPPVDSFLIPPTAQSIAGAVYEKCGRAPLSKLKLSITLTPRDPERPYSPDSVLYPDKEPTLRRVASNSGDYLSSCHSTATDRRADSGYPPPPFPMLTAKSFIRWNASHKHGQRGEGAIVDERLDLQIVHQAPPSEKEWVMVAGNESSVDSVLAISLLYGGRLVSMGSFHTHTGLTYYYAIMHRFHGPVFLKPNPYSYSELLKAAQENEEMDMALTQLCAQEDASGRTFFHTYWERVQGVSFRLWFPSSREADKLKSVYENEGFRLVSLCGYVSKGRPTYVGVWQKPAPREVPYEAHYGLTLRECLQLDEGMVGRHYVATQFRVFQWRDEVLCSAIWEYSAGRRHSIEVGENLHQMYRKQTAVVGTVENEVAKLPRQISHYVDVNGRVKYVVLWSNLHSFRYPDTPDLWAGRNIPASYLPGTKDQLEPAQLDYIARRVERFMRELDIPGLSVAIAKNERLKFAAGYGYANVRRREPVTPHQQFRVGSVSKPITAAAVMLLVEGGRLRLEQRIFGGAGSVFGNEFAGHGGYGRYVTDITVRHLLEHTAGGWNNVDSDPAWLEPEKSTAQLVEQVLADQPLMFRPGHVWIYSNFGYQLLGHVIERVTGQSYEDFVKEHVWTRVDGIDSDDVQVARPTLSERAHREVLYYMSGNKVGFNPYEMLRPERTGPWGGWVASPIELLRLMTRLDGFRRRPDLLTASSIRQWSTPTSASNDTYGLGWSLNIMGFNGWQHDGRMPGSAAMLVRLDNGVEMAVAVNKEYSERDFFHELGYVLHHIANNHDWWKDTRIDLFSHCGGVGDG